MDKHCYPNQLSDQKRYFLSQNVFSISEAKPFKIFIAVKLSLSIGLNNENHYFLSIKWLCFSDLTYASDFFKAYSC